MSQRWAWAEIDTGAIRHNVGLLLGRVEPAAVWAVVKADGYGHGAVAVARAALGAGAQGLCVALVQEGVELRRAGIGAPVLLLSQQAPEQADEIVAHDLTPTVYDLAQVDALQAAVERAGESSLRRRREPFAVHVKVDTGMHRVGCRPRDLRALTAAIEELPELHVGGVFSHFAMADEPDDPANDEQLAAFDAALAGLRTPPPAVHLANSAAALTQPESWRSFVRAGIAVYGIQPGPGVARQCAGLRPAMSVKARVGFTKRLGIGDRVSYGFTYRLSRSSNVATVPIGYADGVPRSFGAQNAEVLIGGRRRPIIGVVTMDQLLVDCGDDDVRIGDEVVLLGSQGTERITAEDWAARAGTIGYEIVCGISARVPRVYV